MISRVSFLNQQRKLFSSLLVIVLLLTTVSLEAQSDGLSSDLINQLSESVVMILTMEDGDVIGQGTGTLISSNGLIYTNEHVTDGGDSYTIALLEDPNEQPVPMYTASLIYTADDLGLDFAILEIDGDVDGDRLAPGSLNLPFVPIADAELATSERGEEVSILGYPGVGEGYLVLTTGTITTIRNGDVCDERMPVWYQTDAEISPGNSGGLAVNRDGVPIGIPTAVNTENVTGGRLGGILPFSAILTALTADDCESAVVDNASSPDLNALLYPPESNVEFECGGADVDNGVQVIVVQMRSGSTYEATVIGIDGFDPVLEISTVDFEEDAIVSTPVTCNDDSDEASNYELTLPDVGTVSGGGIDSHIRFSQNTGNHFANMGMAIGGYDGVSGEFLLILEGMAVTDSDGLGDPFIILLTESVVNSQQEIDVFMVGSDTRLDPYASVLDLSQDADDTPQYAVVNGDELYCDDAGSSDRCFGQTESLNRASIVDGTRSIQADDFDSQLVIPPYDFLNQFGSLSYMVFSSYNYETRGEYTLVFHISIE